MPLGIWHRSSTVFRRSAFGLKQQLPQTERLDPFYSSEQKPCQSFADYFWRENLVTLVTPVSRLKGRGFSPYGANMFHVQQTLPDRPEIGSGGSSLVDAVEPLAFMGELREYGLKATIVPRGRRGASDSIARYLCDSLQTTSVNAGFRRKLSAPPK